MNALKGFSKSILFIIIDTFITLFIYNFIKNDSYVSLLSSIILSMLFIIIYKDKLLKDLKTIKKDINLKTILLSLLFIILSIVTHYILINILNTDAKNQENVINLIKLNPIFSLINIILFGSFKEEIIYHLQYKNDLLSIIISTSFFAICHISFTSINELIYIIPYLMISISFSITYFKTNNIILSTLIHILNNFINVVLLFI